MRNEDYLYRMVAKDQAVFPDIDKRLRRLGVSAEYCVSSVGNRIYRVAKVECDVLPNMNGPVLPTGDKRRAIPLGKFPDVDNMRAQWRCTEWREVA